MTTRSPTRESWPLAAVSVSEGRPLDPPAALAGGPARLAGTDPAGPGESRGDWCSQFIQRRAGIPTQFPNRRLWSP